MSKRTFSSIKSNAVSCDFFETKIGRSYDDSRIKFLSPRNNRGCCQAFDTTTNRTCGLWFRIKSYMTYPLCNKHDKPKFVAAIHAKEYLKSLPIRPSLTDEFINNLATYFTERSLDLKRPIEGGIFYVMRRIDKDIQNNPELYKIGLDVGNENCDFEDRISQHEQGPCSAIFAEGYVTPTHSDCRLVDGLIRRLL
ncbi:4565_t:CDS:2, partial [Funneliformis mosseae]